jgi:hypothetical protein
MNEPPKILGDRINATLELGFGIVLTKSNPAKILPVPRSSRRSKESSHSSRSHAKITTQS